MSKFIVVVCAVIIATIIGLAIYRVEKKRDTDDNIKWKEEMEELKSRGK